MAANIAGMSGGVFARLPLMAGATPRRPATPVEIAIGRTLAVLVHPVAAWRTRHAYRRLLLYSGCFAASYILVLLALQFLSPLPSP
jgi:hypothetical protein